MPSHEFGEAVTPSDGNDHRVWRLPTLYLSGAPLAGSSRQSGRALRGAASKR
jgi:hypothetical protein